MVCTQILVHKWGGLEHGFQHCFIDRLNQSFVSSVAQATASSAPAYVTLMKAKYMQVMPRCHMLTTYLLHKHVQI